MIIAERRPKRSAHQRHPHAARNAPRLAKKIGVATSPGARCRSFCRCVANSALLNALAPPVLEPDWWFFDEPTNIENGKRRQHADPEHAAPAEIGVE